MAALLSTVAVVLMSADMDARRLDELAVRAERSGRICFTRFLDPAMTDAARGAANRAGAQVALFGGYPDAER